MAARRGTTVAAAALIVACAACAPSAPARDDAGEAATDAGADAAPWPAAPRLAPCPPGWRELARPSATVCDPWPTTGRRADCGVDHAHVPGGTGCTRIGSECARDGWPADLPSDRTIVFVDDDAPAGGDGTSRERAVRSVADALALAPAGAILALATGRYDVLSAVVSDRRTLWGACVSGTSITSSVLGDALVLSGAGPAVRNLGLDGTEGPAIVIEGTDAIVADVAIASARDVGIVAISGATARIAGVAVRDVRPDAGGALGIGIYVGGGASLALERVVIGGSRSAALIVTDPGSSGEARDVAIADTLGEESSGSLGYGAHVQAGATLVLERVVIERSHAVALGASGAASRLEARDVLVRDTLTQRSDGRRGLGVAADASAAVVLDRVAIELSRTAAIYADGRGVVVDATDLAIADTEADRAGGASGRAVIARDGALVVLRRAAIERSRELALFAHGEGSAIEASDTLVRETLPSEGDRLFGIGAWAQSGARLELGSCRIVGSRFVGIGSVAGATVSLTDVVVDGVEPAACAIDDCPALAGGIGLAAHLGGSLRATGFEVRGAVLCGVLVGRDDVGPTSMDLERGAITGSAVGACVQVEGYDTDRLRAGVEYRDVGAPLQATSYALPDAL